jgi:glycosyltransferase involved in cell wall biosynthesis
MKIKIFHVIENASFGGGERAFAQIINGLDKKKFEIYIACLPEGIFAEKIRNNAEIIPLDLRNRFNFSNISYLAKIIKEQKIDVIHSQGARADFFARLAGKLAKTPAIISTIAAPVEEYDVNFFKKMVYITLDQFSERFVNRFVVVCASLREKLIKKHKISADKISVIHNGIEIEEYRNDTGDKGDRVRREFNAGEDEPLVGTIGRLVWEKGLTYFVEAIKILDTRCQMPDTRFLIVGEGELRESLELKVKSLKLEDKVILTGFRRDVKEILAALDILVLSSLREGFPMITLEAMAMSKPVVATDIEGIREQVINGETGVLVPPKNPEILAEAILRLTQDHNLRRKMGLAGRKSAEDKFNIKEIIKQHEQLYLMLASKLVSG